jgi:hypothetical protein
MNLQTVPMPAAQGRIKHSLAALRQPITPAAVKKLAQQAGALMSHNTFN